MNMRTITLPIPDGLSDDDLLERVQDLAIELAEEASDDIVVGAEACSIRAECQVVGEHDDPDAATTNLRIPVSRPGVAMILSSDTVPQGWDKIDADDTLVTIEASA